MRERRRKISRDGEIQVQARAQATWQLYVLNRINQQKYWWLGPKLPLCIRIFVELNLASSVQGHHMYRNVGGLDSNTHFSCQRSPCTFSIDRLGLHRMNTVAIAI